MHRIARGYLQDRQQRVCSCQQGQSWQHASRRGAHWQYWRLWRYLRSDEGRRTQVRSRHHLTIHAHAGRDHRWQHAGKDHCKQVTKKVAASLFVQTEDLGLEHVKQSVFGVPAGAPIMGNVFKPCSRPKPMDATCLCESTFYVVDSQCSHSCLQMKS